MDVMMRRRELMMLGGGLPGEYRKVEYLQSPGRGTYINSGVAMSEDLVFEIDFQLIEITKEKYFMGEYSGTAFYLYVSGGENVGYYQTAFGSYWANSNLLADTNRHTFVFSFANGNMNLKNGNDIILEVPIITLSVRNILVAGTTGIAIPVKTFSSKMTKSGIAIQNLIPCVRKSDNKPGMYDTVSHTFYTNAGTGEFTVPN